MDVDNSMFPIVVFNLDECASIQQVITALEHHVASGVTFVGIADGTRGVKMPLGASERRSAADFIKSQTPALRATCAGFCTVSASTIIRGVITAINWVSPLPVPNRVFATRQEAITWAKQQLGERASA